MSNNVNCPAMYAGPMNDCLMAIKQSFIGPAYMAGQFTLLDIWPYAHNVAETYIITNTIYH